MTRPLPILLLLAALIFVPFAQAEIPVTDDTFTTTAAPAKAFGSSIALIVQSPTATGSMASLSEASGYTAYAYMRFDIAAFPNLTTTNLGSAKLRLFVNYVVSPGKFDVYLVGAPWSESTLTASTATSTGAVQTGTPIATGVSVTRALQYLDIDITAALTAWLTDPTKNYGIILVPSNGSNIFASFDSKENLLTGHDPRVTVVVNDASAAQPPAITPSPPAMRTIAITPAAWQASYPKPSMCPATSLSPVR